MKFLMDFCYRTEYGLGGEKNGNEDLVTQKRK
jgi:hypothetical protein